MKINQKITLILATALVMTVAMVVVAYAEYVNVPAWNQGTGRYTQVYQMTVGYNWKFTKDVDAYKSVQKMYPERDALVQCTTNGLTAFPTYYQVRRGDASGDILSNEIAYTGTGTFLVSYRHTISPHTLTCLGIRTDPRCNSSISNNGNWSPDNY